MRSRLVVGGSRLLSPLPMVQLPLNPVQPIDEVAPSHLVSHGVYVDGGVFEVQLHLLIIFNEIFYLGGIANVGGDNASEGGEERYGAKDGGKV